MYWHVYAMYGRERHSVTSYTEHDQVKQGLGVICIVDVPFLGMVA
jgi:hypothetical protein